jgi:uncharacterized DUF497 family protein
MENKLMKIEFDPDKVDTNSLNHQGVTFDEAQAVLLTRKVQSIGRNRR